MHLLQLHYIHALNKQQVGSLVHWTTDVVMCIRQCLGNPQLNNELGSYLDSVFCKTHKGKFEMKKSLIALALVALTASAFATDYSGTSSVQANGGLNNTVATTARSTGIGNVDSFAGSTGMVHGNISASNSTVLTGSSVVQSGGITGAVDTRTTGYAAVVGAGNGVGTANMTGWSDAGTSGSFNGVARLGGIGGTMAGSGSVDAGRPTNFQHGPDVTLSVDTLNHGISAGGTAGGDFSAGGTLAGSLASTGTSQSIDFSINDNKSVHTYAATTYGPMVIGGVSYAPVDGSASALNAGADATANVHGDFNVNVLQNSSASNSQ